MPEAEGALRGLRIVEWGSGFSAPLCARLPGDLGAEVIAIAAIRSFRRPIATPRAGGARR